MAVQAMIMGDGAVGKTTLAERMKSGEFKKQIMTIGLQIHVIKAPEEELDTVQLYDMGGQRQFRNLVKTFYKDGMLAVACFDVTRWTSLSNLKLWMELACPKSAVLVGCKADLEHKVKLTDAQQWAARMNICDVFYVSAKEGTGVKDLMDYIAAVKKWQKMDC